MKRWSTAASALWSPLLAPLRTLPRGLADVRAGFRRVGGIIPDVLSAPGSRPVRGVPGARAPGYHQSLTGRQPGECSVLCPV